MNRPGLKASLREEMLARRRAMSPGEVEGLSSLVEQSFLALPEYEASKRLALYASFENEVLTTKIFSSALKSGKEVYFPRSVPRSRELSFIRVRSPRELTPGFFEINEPGADGDEAKVDSFDLVVVPGVSFDLEGSRVGYGMGFYDRALAGVSSPVVALAYDFQVTQMSIPIEAHDVSVNALITESGTRRFNRQV